MALMDLKCQKKYEMKNRYMKKIKNKKGGKRNKW